MRTGQLAQLLGVTRGTINTWVHKKEVKRFFSLEAIADGAHQAIYNQSDVDILATIYHLRNTDKIIDWEEIAKQLDTGERHEQVPVSAVSMDRRTVTLREAEVSAKYLATVSERDSALQRVGELSEEITRLRQEVSKSQSAHREDVERLMREIAKLNRELGALEAGQKGQGNK